jgi:hypothetical protein
MRKKIFLLFIIFSSVMQLFGKNWYVSTTSSGTGSGDSWANKKIWSSFNTNLPEPGDTVFIDGGTTGMTYVLSSTWFIYSDGVAGNKIIYTRDFSDPNHYGQPLFTGTASQLIYLSDANYVELSHIRVYGTNTTTYKQSGVYIGGDYVDILHNEFDFTNGWGINGESVNNINIMYNDFQSQDLTGTALSNMQAATNANGGVSVQCDPIAIRYAHSIDVGFNNFYVRTNIVHSPEPSADLSRDIIQMPYSNPNNVLTPIKLYNNFIILNHSNTASTTEIFTFQNGTGNVWIYNNIVVCHSGQTQLFQFSSSATLNAYVYNNTFVMRQSNPELNYLPGLDLLSFKNNLLYSTSNDLMSGFTGTYDFSNNIYDGDDFSSFISAHDPTSSNAGFTLVDNDFSSLSINPSDYQIALSDGIDDGVSLSTYFTNDYEDNTRGLIWDIGAFEGTGLVEGDIISPDLVDAEVIDSTTIELIFSEALENSSALVKTNYSINNGIIVNSASLSTDLKKVTLSTTLNTANQTYTVVVSNVKDLAGNIISSINNSAQYSYIGDSTPPNLISASVINSTTIELIFSEALENSSALVKTNYSINNGIVVNSASLSTDLKKVTLSTTLNTANQTYTVVVSNVKDLAGNIISSINNSAQYEFAEQTGDLVFIPIASAYATHWFQNYTPDKVIDGQGISNPVSRWNGAFAMPDTIKLDLGTSTKISRARVSFFNWDGGRIYKFNLMASLDGINWQTVVSQVWSSAAEWTEINFNIVNARYLSLISLENNQSVYAGIWEMEVWGSNFSGTDTTPPNLLSASLMNPTTLDLLFSEAIESNSAQLKSNYTINNGVVVDNVIFSTDNKKVTLNTTANAPNQTYTVVVNNVKDLAGNIISSNNNAAQYSYVGDTTPPNLLSVAVLGPSKIELLFSEALETVSAQTNSFYTISNGIIVNSATLSFDKNKVTLNTTLQSPNQNYIVTVNNVKDLAGNTISSNNSVQYSFEDNTVGDLLANVKIFLQGPYQSSGMINELSGNEFIPNEQPYNTGPWLYNGSEALVTGSSSSTRVDWVLIELRNAENPLQVISRRAGLLRNDGRIMEPDGSIGVTFKKVLYGSYYIAVYHRNHLAVMTSTPVLFNPGNTLYDFTNSSSKAYGQNAMIEIATGIFGMYAGDGNGDGIIYDSDRNEIWSYQNGNLGYLDGDFNLDSGVTIKDINEYWNLNQGKITQVPQITLQKAPDNKILGALNYDANLR